MFSDWLLLCKTY